MKCISLWQPWATLWVSGLKVHETRGWDTCHRGPLLVHAAKHRDYSARDLCVREDAFVWALRRLGIASFDDLPFGAIVGQVEIIRTVRTERVTARWPEYDPFAPWDPDNDTLMPPDWWFGNYAPGRWAWEATRPVMFAKPIPFRGSQGLFEVPDWPFGHIVIPTNAHAEALGEVKE